MTLRRDVSSRPAFSCHETEDNEVWLVDSTQYSWKEWKMHELPSADDLLTTVSLFLFSSELHTLLLHACTVDDTSRKSHSHSTVGTSVLQALSRTLPSFSWLFFSSPLPIYVRESNTTSKSPSRTLTWACSSSAWLVCSSLRLYVSLAVCTATASISLSSVSLCWIDSAWR